MGALCAVKCFNISTIIHATKEQEREVGTTTLLYHEEDCLQHKYLGYEWVCTFLFFNVVVYKISGFMWSCRRLHVFKTHFSSKGLLIGIFNSSCSNMTINQCFDAFAIPIRVSKLKIFLSATRILLVWSYLIR